MHSSYVRGRTSNNLFAFICITSFIGSSSFLVIKDLVEVSTVSRRVMFQPLSNSITERHSLSPHSYTRNLISLPYDLPAFEEARLRGFHVPPE
jgi:hypothetical protein